MLMSNCPSEVCYACSFSVPNLESQFPKGFGEATMKARLRIQFMFLAVGITVSFSFHILVACSMLQRNLSSFPRCCQLVITNGFIFPVAMIPILFLKGTDFSAQYLEPLVLISDAGILDVSQF
jgi:hypothetical protein